MITPEVISAHNLTQEEFERIKKLLGREPNLVELGIFSVMWSEHCSYKSSRVHLKRLPTTGERVIVPPGENAGVVDVGDGWCAAFKIESHNHPSFIEPFQGAATGVGGILRDVFTMGARPIAAMNSLRFGSLDHPKYGRRNRSLLAGVVAGIAHYGNAFGVATIGGEVAFDDAYTFNPLVNAFALGLVREDQIFFGKATGVGNPVLYVGAKTGRDGIHGATMASAEFDEEALEKRPTVQVGDPFLEKLLLEACLEAMRSGAVAGIQDMGAAGLTSSSCEMAARAGTGIELNLSLVPQRETGMTAYEMLLSESQERMLIVAHSGREREVIDIFRKWELDAVVVGRVREGGRMQVVHEGETVADIPVAALTDEAPVYHRSLESGVSSLESRVWSLESGVSSLESGAASTNSFVTKQPQTLDSRLATPDSPAQTLDSRLQTLDSSAQTPDSRLQTLDSNAALVQLLASPNIASKQWVYRQYDHMVRTNTAILPGADAAVVRIKETRRGLALTLDSNGRYCAADPRAGARLLVAESARNVVCVGARPLAITNCLNFASPERPQVMWSFSEVIDGIAEACRAFNTPVVSGNVSFYNETEGRGILPTPVIGMVGLVEDVRRVIQPGFKNEDDVIALLGETRDDLSLSEYAATVQGSTTEQLISRGIVPRIDLEQERAVQSACLEAAEAGLLQSAHDCSEGGLGITLVESCFSSLNREAMGANMDLQSSLAVPNLLFSETPSRIVISFAPSALEKIKRIAEQHNCPCTIIGRTGGNRLKIHINATLAIDSMVAELEEVWRSALPRKLLAEAMAAGME